MKLYVEDVIGVTFAHCSLLEKWISLPTHKALVAVKENGDVVGFAATRESVTLDKTGYRLAPLLTDCGDIARLLVLKLVSSNQKFSIRILNAEAKKMANEMKGKKYEDTVRMYTRGEIPIKKEKYFGVFGAPVG